MAKRLKQQPKKKLYDFTTNIITLYFLNNLKLFKKNKPKSGEVH